MKIRTDFVTNSSSVSYILTLCEEMVDIHMRVHGVGEKDPKTAKIINTLRDNMHKNGTHVYLEGKEMITKMITFDTSETLDEDSLETTFEKLTDDELWSYILGEYILNGKLCGIMGFGITQVETF